MLPRRPRGAVVPFGTPAVKYSVLPSPPFPPLPKARAHRPAIEMALPFAPCRRTDLVSRIDVERVDRAVPKISHQQVPSKGAPSGGRDRDTPGRIQRAIRYQPAQQIAVEVVHVDNAIPGPRHIQELGRILLRIGYVELPVQRPDVERGESGWQIWIGESPWHGRRGERPVKHIDLARTEISRVEQWRGCAGIDRQTLVHGAGARVIHHHLSEYAPVSRPKWFRRPWRK